MAYLELYPIVVSAVLWEPGWPREYILFHCDNAATVHILKTGRSKCPDIMRLMRRLTFYKVTYTLL